MLENDQDAVDEGDMPEPENAPETPAKPDTPTPPPVHDDSIIEELGAVIDDAKLYATAEIAFQRTRAKLLIRNVGIAAGAGVVALILLHIAIIALAVGLVMALEPYVTIWGAIAIVVGLMLLGVYILVRIAAAKARIVSELFSSDPGQPDQGEASSSDAGESHT